MYQNCWVCCKHASRRHMTWHIPHMSECIQRFCNHSTTPSIGRDRCLHAAIGCQHRRTTRTRAAKAPTHKHWLQKMNKVMRRCMSNAQKKVRRRCMIKVRRRYMSNAQMQGERRKKERGHVTGRRLKGLQQYSQWWGQEGQDEEDADADQEWSSDDGDGPPPSGSPPGHQPAGQPSGQSVSQQSSPQADQPCSHPTH